MRSTLTAVSFLTIFLLMCLGYPQTQVAAQTLPPASTKTSSPRNPGMSETGWNNELIQRKLNQACSIDFDDRPWNEIEEYLEQTLRCNIILLSSARDDSLGEDEPITCNLSGISYRHALRLMLAKMNATFIVRQGVIKILSKDDVEDPKYMANFTIGVQSLLANISRKETERIGKPRVKKTVAKTQNATSVVGTVSAVELNTAESLLIDLVQSSFRASRWKESGQGDATFKIIGGQGIAFCDDEMADDLRDFLKDLDYQISRD